MSKSDEFDLVSGDTTIVSFNAEIPEDAFEETRDEITIAETAPVRVYTNGSIEDYSITRKADIALEELMNKSITLSDENGNTYTDKITMKTGDLLMLSCSIDGEDSANYPKLNIVSDSEDIISVTNGVLTAEKAGTAKIEVKFYPTIDTYVTNDSDYMRMVDTYNTLPSCLIKTVTLDAEVKKLTSSHSGGGSSSLKPTEKPDATPVPTENPSQSGNWFKDVSENAWYYDSVKYAFENGLMRGVSDAEFAPEEKLTRAMFVTVLYRMENEPDMSEEILGYPFKDIDSESWYTDAVYWARQNDIINGVNENEFAPNDNITREQMSAIMFRYAQYKGIAPTDEWAIHMDYADLEEISDWAQEAVMYCKLQGIMQGKDNNMFAPKDNATRAETAAILQRFSENEYTTELGYSM